ncbi:MAG TPA: metallophosphoesterase [Chitinophagaceae bacterium]|nr:metallophosphoesterase [Chitinophagaceae bacterium]
MLTRRSFIKKSGIAGGMLLLGPMATLGSVREQTMRLTILHTNDTQGLLEPFPENAPQFAGMGGMQARADLIQKIRSEERNVLLFDSGDFFQGGPDFDLYQGKPQIRAMQLMGYNAVGIGAHEFDGGMGNLARQIQQAGFSFLCCNYNVQDSALAGRIQPYLVIVQGGLKIGVLGVSPDLKGRIPETEHKGIVYLDPIDKANETALYLSKKQKCDFVICLSHLGLNDQVPVNDKTLAKESLHINLIIGGHSHTLLQQPLKYFNRDKEEVLIVQAAWGGTHLGRIDYLFSSKKNILSTNAQTVEIGK